MTQPTLFDSSDALLADDERGRIVYTPGVVDAATAQAWFGELLKRERAAPGDDGESGFYK